MAGGKLITQLSDDEWAVMRAMPKATLFLVAFYLARALIGEDGGDRRALARLVEEWQALHLNGLVPHKVPRRIYALRIAIESDSRKPGG